MFILKYFNLVLLKITKVVIITDFTKPNTVFQAIQNACVFYKIKCNYPG